ncbi:MAG: patatin-like phospholipase family protein [Elusimicrobia bacterium]|nr:patatin-like phospholipase family protein [Elusimicrobiota bacterium]
MPLANDSLLKSKRPFRVLSLDGGGMRGLYTACLLDHLSSRFAQQRNTKPLDIGKGFDLIVGTSTGGILACALAKGVPISEITSLYRKEGPQIFVDPMPHKDHRFRFFKWCVRNRSKASNSNHILRSALSRIFGDTTLEQLHKTRGIAVCIPR